MIKSILSLFLISSQKRRFLLFIIILWIFLQFINFIYIVILWNDIFLIKYFNIIVFIFMCFIPIILITEDVKKDISKSIFLENNEIRSEYKDIFKFTELSTSIRERVNKTKLEMEEFRKEIKRYLKEKDKIVQKLEKELKEENLDLKSKLYLREILKQIQNKNFNF